MKIATNTEDDCAELMRYFQNRGPLSKALSLSKQVLDSADKTRGSYHSTMFDKLNIFADLSLCSLTSANEITFSDMAEKPIALFLQIPDEKETRHTLAAMVLLQAYKELVAKANTYPELSLPRSVYFLMDEFGNLPPIHKMEQMVTVGRSRNLWLCLVIQSYAQLAKVYDEKVADIIKSNCNIQMFIGTSDYKTVTYLLDKSGKYIVQAVNHAGKSQEFILYLSLDDPKIEGAENAEDKTFEICVTDSADKYAGLQTLVIEKSTDGGKTWIVLTADDYGKAVSVDNLSYRFRTSGIYRVTLTDEFRTGIDAVIAQFAYEQPAPDGVLAGVENGGTTKGAVTLSDLTEKATVEIYKDGEKIEYALGSELTEVGQYRIVLTDELGNSAEYTFEILYSVNGGAIALIVIAVLVVVGVIVTVVIMRKKGKFGKNKEEKKKAD